MEANYISYEALIASRDAVDWAFWSMVGTWCSVSISGLTLIFAWKALSTWRDQEKNRVKADFKKAILAIRNTLLFMPGEWNREQVALSANIQKMDGEIASRMASKLSPNIVLLSRNYESLIVAHNNANDAWVMCEHLFVDTIIQEKWQEFNAGFNKYMQGGYPHSVLFEPLNNLYSQPFVFEGR